jgi:hypothetical protein
MKKDKIELVKPDAKGVGRKTKMSLKGRFKKALKGRFGFPNVSFLMDKQKKDLSIKSARKRMDERNAAKKAGAKKAMIDAGKKVMASAKTSGMMKKEKK